MPEPLKILKKVENGLVSHFRGTEAYAKKIGAEVVGDVEDLETEATRTGEEIYAEQVHAREPKPVTPVKDGPKTAAPGPVTSGSVSGSDQKPAE